MTAFNYFGRSDVPSFVLCNPDKTQIYTLGKLNNRIYKPRYNALSELSFTAYSEIDGITNDYFDYLQYKRLIYLDGIGYFLIRDIDQSNNGFVKIKNITAYSFEAVLANKKISSFSGTYNIYDSENFNNSLIDIILSYVPGWSLQYVDDSLLNTVRTFDETDINIYEFLMTTVEESYQCVFSFDIINSSVSIYSIDNATLSTDIYISFDNLIEQIDIKTITEEMATALTVTGSGDLSINQVNPLGGDKIYNFGYYKTLTWMSQDLINALTNWEGAIDYYQPIYANLLTDLQVENANLITLNSELVELNSEMDALLQARSVRVEQGLSVLDENAQITAKQTQIDNKQNEISNSEEIIANYTTQLENINNALSFESNFTESQISTLGTYIDEDTYHNENFVQTGIMTIPEIQDQAQQLYDQGVSILSKLSQPRYEFSVDMINFLELEEFSQFKDQLSLGAVIYLALDDNISIEPVVLGYDIDYEDPSNFSMLFGNRLRLDDSTFIFTDIIGQSIKQSNKTSFKSREWSDWSDNYKSQVDNVLNAFSGSSSAKKDWINNSVSGSSAYTSYAFSELQTSASALDQGTFNIGYWHDANNQTSIQFLKDIIRFYVQKDGIFYNMLSLTNDSIIVSASLIGGDLSFDGLDASDVTYTPENNLNWYSNSDPGNADSAFDQLAQRLYTIESGTSEYSVILYNNEDQSYAYYPPDNIGIESALSSSRNGDIVFLPAGIYSGPYTIPNGVSLIGADINQCVLNDEITLLSGANLNQLSIIRSGSSLNAMNGVVLSGSNCHIFNCSIDITNLGGDARCIYGEIDSIGYVDVCIVSASSPTAEHGYYTTDGIIYVRGGSNNVSSSPIGGV